MFFASSLVEKRLVVGFAAVSVLLLSAARIGMDHCATSPHTGNAHAPSVRGQIDSGCMP